MKHLRWLSILLLAVAQPALAILPADEKAVSGFDTIFFDPNAPDCATGTGASPDSLDGHTLPASSGGTGLEEAIDEQGRVASTGGRVAFAQHASVSQEFRDYYITMRWRFRLWNWNGTNETGPEDSAFYASAPRVLVTNPRTGKSIIAVVMESGPAPWTGVDRSSNNDPKQGWTNPQDGTPATYRGRVSGFPPVAFQELGATMRMADGSGDDLVYAWAPDQSATPGPTTLSAGSGGAGGGGGCSAGAANFVKRITYTGRTITPTAIVLHWTGGSQTVDETIAALASNNACGTGGCSVQLTIDAQGTIWQLTDPINTLTAHAAGINDKSIGIEISSAGPSVEAAEASILGNQTQKQSVINAVVSLMNQFNIQLDPDIEGKKGLLGHYETDAASYGGQNGKSDPGRIYMAEIRAAVEAALASGEAGGATCNSNTYLADNAGPGSPCDGLNGQYDATQRGVLEELRRTSQELPHAQTTAIGPTRIATSIHAQLQRMITDAQAAGVTLEPVVGWRSFDGQVYERRLFCGTTFHDIYQKPAGQCSPPTALPGKSQHQEGLAMDFGVGGLTNSQTYSNTPAYRWLVDNAANYGLRNLAGEPWHWSTTGN